MALYADLGRPDLPDAPLAQRKVDTRGMSGVEAALAHVEQQLAANPDDGPGWSLVAPVYMRLGRFDDAVEAYTPVAAAQRRERGACAPITARRWSAPRAAIVTADARAAFDKALAEQPGLPSARFYLGLAAEQDGDLQKAIAIYRALLGDAPPRGAVDAGLAGAARRADRRRRAGSDAAPQPPTPTQTTRSRTR